MRDQHASEAKDEQEDTTANGDPAICRVVVSFSDVHTESSNVSISPSHTKRCSSQSKEDLRSGPEYDRTHNLFERTIFGQLFDETLTTPRVVVIRGKACHISRASPTNQYERSSQEERTASKGKQKEVHNQSSVEVEQLLPPIGPVHDPRNHYASDSPDGKPVEVEHLLPPIEPVHDPQNLYASDSPVIEEPDSDEELYKSAEDIVESVDLDGQDGAAANGSNSELNVCFLDSTKLVIANKPEAASTTSASPEPIFADHYPSFTCLWAFVFTGANFASQVSSALPRNPDRADQSEGALGCSSPSECSWETEEPVRRKAKDNALAKLVRIELSSLLGGKPPYGFTPRLYFCIQIKDALSQTLKAVEQSKHSGSSANT
ncbi:hypothetical protein EI94DRAFT_1705070, partial [Lactarius quietus]